VGRFRALGIVAGIVLGIFVLGAVFVALASQESSRQTTLDGPVSRVEVLSERGAVTLRGGSGPVRIAERRKWILSEPTVSANVADGVLTIRVTCPSWAFASCSADVTADVPAAAVIDAKTVRGRLEVDGITADVKAVSEDGDVAVSGVSADTVEARAVTGDVAVELRTVPRVVRMRSETGDVTLRLPAAAYAVRADSAVGTERLDGITNTPGAARSLEVTSGKGAVVVSAR